jgi:hypothetical protein
VNQICYAAAWTDSGCFLTCDDHHVTIDEAVACIPCAGGYVVAVEEGVLRYLTAGEEAVFQVISHRTEIPPARPVGRSTSDTPALRSEGETLLEIVSRVMSAYRFVREEDTEVHLGSIHLANVQRTSNDGGAQRAGDHKQNSKVA